MQKGRIAVSLVAITTLLLLGFFTIFMINNPSSQADAARFRLIRHTIKQPSPTPTYKLIATPTPTSIPTSTPTPTLKPTATPTPKPTTNPTPTPTPPTSSVADYLLNQINNYRKSNGLSSVTSNSETCSFAAIRAQEISTNFNHDGFTNRVNSKTLPYPSYHEVAENIAMNSNYTQVIDQWINSPGHAANMRKDTPYVCVAKYGNFYAYEGWRP